MYQDEVTHLGVQFLTTCRIGLRREPQRAQEFFGIELPKVAEGIMNMEPGRIRELCELGLPYIIPRLGFIAEEVGRGRWSYANESELPDWERQLIDVVFEHIHYLRSWAKMDPGLAALWGRVSTGKEFNLITSLPPSHCKPLAHMAYKQIRLDPSVSMQMCIVFSHQEAAMDRLVVSKSVSPIAL